jgi:hypothetical protein
MQLFRAFEKKIKATYFFGFDGTLNPSSALVLTSVTLY